MPILSVIAIAIGLAMDAFAVSITSGATIRTMRLRHALLIASFFGAFQAFMPYIGWSIGQLARVLISNVDHWVAFALLAAVGGKMIYEARAERNEETVRDPLNIYVLFMLSIATSIDALAVGISLSFLDISILTPIVVIGLVTFVFSFAGTYIGDMFGHFFERKFEVLGGLILIGIGVKILIEHLYLG